MSTLRKKQAVAITGLLMILFLCAHLAGNLLIYVGPEALNNYADYLSKLLYGSAIWISRILLLTFVSVHIFFTLRLKLSNLQARKPSYKGGLKNHSDFNTLALKTMPITGTIILVYLIVHLMDFTLAEKVGIINGVDYGLYGLVVNTLRQPYHAAFYIIAMLAIGMHLAHAIQSLFQTFGLNNEVFLLRLKRFSYVISLILSIGFAMIPIYIYFFV